MARTAFTVSLHMEGARETLAAFGRLPREAQDALRDASLKLATSLARSAQTAAAADSAPQTRLLVPTIKAKRDRIPVIEAGGAKRVGRNRVPAWKVLFGSEFGSHRFKQFGRPHAGRRGYWFFPTVERESSVITKAWAQAADDVARAFGDGQ